MIERARGSLFFLLTYSIYCLIALRLPDHHILVGKKELTLPLIGAVIPVSDFLMMGPFLLLAGFSYYWALISSLSLTSKQGYLFYFPDVLEIKNIFFQFFVVIISIGLVPIILFVFANKAPIIQNNITYHILCFAGTLMVLVLHYLRFNKKNFINSSAIFLILACIVVLVYFVFHSDRKPNLDFAPLNNTDLRSRDFSGASFREAQLKNSNLSAAILKNADLTRANLTNAQLISSNLNDANLTGSNLKGANLGDIEQKDWAEYSIFTKSKSGDIAFTISQRYQLIVPIIPGTSEAPSMIYHATNLLPSSTLIDADLTLANANKANFNGVNFTKAFLIGTNFEDSSFVNSIFIQSVFGGNLSAKPPNIGTFKNITEYKNYYIKNIESCNFLSNLTGANFLRSLMIFSDLRCTTFENANLQFTNMSYSIFGATKLSGANLEFAVLEEVIGLSCIELQSAVNWKKTIRSENLLCGESSLTWNDYLDEFKKRFGLGEFK